MRNYAKLYWLTRLDSIQAMAVTFIVLSAIALFIYYIAMAVDCYDSEDRAEYHKDNRIVRRIFYPLLAFGILASVFIPNKNEAILIFAGGKTMNFIQQDSSISKIPSQTTAIISQFMENQLKELDKKDTVKTK